MRFKKRADHRRYNGAMLLGLRGLVIKSHGSADRYGFFMALNRAYEAANNQMVDKIAAAFAQADFVLEGTTNSRVDHVATN